MSIKRIGSIRGRYFLFYSLSALVPLFVFSFIYWFAILPGVKHELLAEYDQDASGMLSYADYRTQQLDQYAAAFSNHIYGSLEDLNDEGYGEATGTIISDMLEEYEKSFGNRMRAFYYEKGSKHMHTSSGMVPYAEFEKDALAGVDLYDIPVFMISNGLSFKTVRHKYPYTFIFYPVPEFSYIPSASLIFMIDNFSIHESSSQFFERYRAEYEIRSPRGELIVSSSPAAEGRKAPSSDSMSLRLRSEISGNVMECWADRDDVLGAFITKKDSFFAVSFTAFSVMMALAWILSGISYLPIRNLMNILGRKDRGLHRDEMKYISEHLTDMVDENTRLAMRLESSSLKLERIIVDRLMLGELDKSDEDMAEITEGLSSVFLHELYQVVILIPGDGENAALEELELVRRYLESFGDEDVSLFLTGLNDGGNMILILNSDIDDPSFNACDLMNGLRKNFDLSWRASTSLMHGSLGDLSVAYIEAGIALEHAPETGVSCFNESERSVSSFVIPQASTNLFQHAVRNGDSAAALKILDSLFRYVDESRAIAVLKQGMLYDIFNLVLRCAEGMGSGDLPVRHMLSEFKDPEKLKSALSDVVSRVIKDRNERESSKRESEIRDIREHVDANYRDNQISLSDLSDKFGYSVSSLSRLFKISAGKGFVDYLADLRFKWIKAQLLDSDRPLKDIIMESGYTNISGTMKKFKEREGMTMKEWRDLNRNRY